MSYNNRKNKYHGKVPPCRAKLGDDACPPATRVCKHQQGDCEERRMLTFWLDPKGNRKSGELQSGFFLFLWTLVLVTWLWVLLSIVSAVFWTLLFNEADVTFAVDGAAIGIVLSFATFFVIFFWTTTDAKRTASASAFISLVSATKNVSSTLFAMINRKALMSNPEVSILTHNGCNAKLVKMPAVQVFKRIALALNAVIAGQRNSLRDQLETDLLPLLPDQIAEIKAARYVDPLESLQSMILRYVNVLMMAGILDNTGVRVASNYYKDKIDSLGNLDVGGKIPVSESVIQFSNLLLLVLTVVVPLWFSRVYPGYAAVWISPIVLIFYYALVGYAKVQYKIAVTQEENIFTGIALVEEMYTGAETNYNWAVRVARVIEELREEEGNEQTDEMQGAQIAAGAPIFVEVPVSTSRTGSGTQIKIIGSSRVPSSRVRLNDNNNNFQTSSIGYSPAQNSNVPVGSPFPLTKRLFE